MRGRFGNRLKSWKTKRRNKKLCKQYPFLIPWNRWSGYLITECTDGKKKGYWPGNPDEFPTYNYSYTELDNMPIGWRKAFGLQMCQELKDELVKCDDLDRWRIVDLKEKYGSMRLYDNGYKSDSKIPDIIAKYEGLSARTCIICGKPATKITTGWISPFCDDCCPNERAVSIEEYYDMEVYE